MLIVRKVLYLDFTCGSDIKEALEFALDYSRKTDSVVRFHINGVDMEVYFHHTFFSLEVEVERVYHEFQRKLKETIYGTN